jgi:hypothetical protein
MASKKYQSAIDENETVTQPQETSPNLLGDRSEIFLNGFQDGSAIGQDYKEGFMLGIQHSITKARREVLGVISTELTTIRGQNLTTIDINQVLGNLPSSPQKGLFLSGN